MPCTDHDGRVIIVDAGIGNAQSVANMFKHLRIPTVVCRDPEMQPEPCPRSMVVIPGVGAFDEGMRRLNAGRWSPWIHAAANECVVLGLCLGMQILCEGSDEGTESGLGLIPGHFRRFEALSATGRKLKVPHMGWSQVEFDRVKAPWAAALTPPQRFYFVHSFQYTSDSTEAVVGWTTYGNSFASAVARDRIIGLQFHPEKSHRFGMNLLRSIWEWGRA